MLYVVAALYPAEKNTDRELYPHYTTVLNLTNIEFPILKDISKFEF